MGIVEDCRREALYKCHELGLHPTPDPLGDSHHTDVPFTAADDAEGDALAYFLGTLFADVGGEGLRYWYYKKTSFDEWRRVARALRIHGLKIVDAAPVRGD